MYALIISPPSKTDRFGIVWGASLCTFLSSSMIYTVQRYTCGSWSWDDYPLHGEHRLAAPLFAIVQDVGVPFTFHVLCKPLAAVKPLIMPDVEDNSLYTYHSFRVLLATQLGSSRCLVEEIQSMCRWLSPASVALCNRMQPQ